MVSSCGRTTYKSNISRCLTRQHQSGGPSPRASLGFLGDLDADAASRVNADSRRELGDRYVSLSDSVTEPLSRNPQDTRDIHRNLDIPSQHSFDDYHMHTPFTVVSSIPKVSRWQKRSSRYKDDHVKQKKIRRQRNRIAITLLTFPLPLELRCSSIRPLNEEIRRLGWWEKREGLNECQRVQLGIYLEVQREWQKLLKA